MEVDPNGENKRQKIQNRCLNEMFLDIFKLQSAPPSFPTNILNVKTALSSSQKEYCKKFSEHFQGLTKLWATLKSWSSSTRWTFPSLFSTRHQLATHFVFCHFHKSSKKALEKCCGLKWNCFRLSRRWARSLGCLTLTRTRSLRSLKKCCKLSGWLTSNSRTLIKL